MYQIRKKKETVGAEGPPTGFRTAAQIRKQELKMLAALLV
jgi:hypothetical protein